MDLNLKSHAALFATKIRESHVVAQCVHLTNTRDRLSIKAD